MISSPSKSQAERRLGPAPPTKKLLDASVPREVKELVSEAHREISKEIDDVREGHTEDALIQLKRLTARNERTNRHVTEPTHAAQNAVNLRKLGEASRDMAYMVSGTRPMSVADLSAAIRSNFRMDTEDETDWAALGTVATTKCFLTPPGFYFMNGPFTLPAKVRKVAERREKDSVAAVVRPTEIQDASVEEKTQTDARVKHLGKFLRKLKEPVPYYKFVVNPESFTQTVENIFDFSFLVKQGEASLTIRDGELTAAAVRSARAEDGAAPAAAASASASASAPAADPKQQKLLSAVLSFSYRHFLDAIEAYGIKEAMIPTRPVALGGGKRHAAGAATGEPLSKKSRPAAAALSSKEDEE